MLVLATCQCASSCRFRTQFS
ncbi:hypothetical protein F383_23030 [Gossypium arboreum]|uniref:Uncharacterized protein n=1 Tax=Gossypium arboreum TaxID=29729 RepID=A0A0B0NW94_GOSAR|nr:hypothetical protein F383_23030 [Gossypium arboreum]